MSGKLAYTMTNDTITVIVDGKPQVIPASSKSFVSLQQALIAQNWSLAKKLASPAKFIMSWARPEQGWNVDVERGVIQYKGSDLPEKLYARMLSMAREEVDPQCWAKFWERVQANPSHRSATQLYDFMDHAGIPITVCGMIMAYKSVRPNFLDWHSSTIDNSPGKVIEYPRNKVSDDPRTPCHEGLHVGAYEYASGFGDGDKIILEVEVDPADVVCVPYDHNSQKVRCCKYRVVRVMEEGKTMPDLIHKGSEEEDLTGHEGMGTVSLDDDDDDDDDDDRDYDDDDDWNDDNTDTGGTIATNLDIMSQKLRTSLEMKTIGEIRKIAGPEYGVKNASKIPGGKSALIDAILAQWFR